MWSRSATKARESPLKIWSDCYLWSFPYYLLGAGIAFAMSYSNERFGWHSLLVVVPALIVLYKSFSMYFSRLEAESAHSKEMAELHLRTIEALASHQRWILSTCGCWTRRGWEPTVR